MKKLLIILFWLISISLNATTYYVATTGTDGAYPTRGTLANPWLTWQYAFNTAIGHDTVYFRGGVYATTQSSGYGLVIPNDGTSGNYICFFAYPADYVAGNYPVLDCAAVPAPYNFGGGFYGNIGMYLNDNHYIYIKGLQIKNVNQFDTATPGVAYGILCYNALNLKLENMVIHDVNGTGYELTNFDTLYVTNCDAYTCCDLYSLNRPGDGGQGFHGGNSATSSGYRRFFGCRAWDCSDQGYSMGGSRALTVYDSCWSFGNGLTTGNVYGEGNGFKIGYMTTISTAPVQGVFQNCIAAYNTGRGFNGNDAGYYAQSLHLYNNLSYHNGYGGVSNANEGFFFENTISSDVDELKRIFRNNISYDSYGADFYLSSGAVVTQSNNNWGIPITINSGDFVSLDTVQLDGARQADGLLPVITFGHLSDGSQAINQGVDVGLPFNSDKPDLGAFEYTVGAPPTPPYVATSPPINVNIRQGTGRGIVTDDGGTAVSDRIVCWGTSVDPLISGSHVHCGTGEGAFSGTITGLSSSTTYHVRAYATNGAGTYGDDISVTTPDWGVGYSGGKVVFYNDKIVIVK